MTTAIGIVLLLACLPPLLYMAYMPRRCKVCGARLRRAEMPYTGRRAICWRCW
jgi:hypothetical protein